MHYVCHICRHFYYTALFMVVTLRCERHEAVSVQSRDLLAGGWLMCDSAVRLFGQCVSVVMCSTPRVVFV